MNNKVDTINTSTGTATAGPGSSGFTGSFYGLAPNPIPTGTTTPEAATWSLLGAGITALLLFRRSLSGRTEK